MVHQTDDSRSTILQDSLWRNDRAGVVKRSSVSATCRRARAKTLLAMDSFPRDFEGKNSSSMRRALSIARALNSFSNLEQDRYERCQCNDVDGSAHTAQDKPFP